MRIQVDIHLTNFAYSTAAVPRASEWSQIIALYIFCIYTNILPLHVLYLK